MNSNVEPKYEKNPFSSYQMFTRAVIEKARNGFRLYPRI
jgi:UDP-glucose 4-epimerase